MHKTRIPRSTRRTMRSLSVSGVRLGMGVVFMAMLLLPRSVRAHTPGLSLADFDVRPDGRVDAQLTFASADLLGGVNLDRDRDGVITPEEVSAATDDLRVFALEEVGVDADGSSCSPSFRGASLTEADGLVLHASYTCPADAAEIGVILYYLSAGARGQPHEGLARLVAGDAKSEGLLTGEHRAIALHRPGKTHAASRKWTRIVAFVSGAIFVVFLAWSSSRWRQSRAAWQNRSP